MRTHEQSILVGTNTAEADNPSLTARKYFGKNPLRLVIDKDLKLNRNNKLFDGQSGTVIFYDRKQKVGDGVKNVVYRGLDFDKDITNQICDVFI
ncbi:MAG: dihydrofolate reductase family protein [Flavobacteriaceae bacterium]|nr:dihydrofolate reductase family protein [Flavobacteriaceae bacterium]